MIINRDNLRMLTTGFRANFQAGLGSVAPMWSRIATEVPSTTSEELYPWLGQIPGMRKWIGDRQINNVRTDAYRLRNESWEQTVSVEKEAIEDDRYGVYAPLMSAMGQAAAAQPDELIFSTLPMGFETVCFDGQNFFDADHPVIQADGTVASVSNMQAGSGAPWYLMDTTKPLKPLIFQNRKRPEFTALDNPDDENVFHKKTFLYGSDARNTAGFGFWQVAFGSKAALDTANFEAAYDAMLRLKGDHGRPLAITPNILITGPTNRSAAEQILLKQTLAGGETNLNFRRVELVIAPWLG